MDPVTHIVSGALAGRALKLSLPARLGMVLCVLAAWLPDVDNFVGLSPEQYLLHHRGITHSLVGIAVQAMLLTGVFRLLSRGFDPLRTFIVSAGLLTVHVYLDVVTTYGTQVLAPFDTTRFAWGSVFIIDPILTLTGLGMLLWSLFAKRWHKRIAVAGLSFMLIYPLCTMSVKNTVATAVPEILREQNVAYDDFTVSTDLLSPVLWKLIVQEGDTLRVGSISVLPALDGPLTFMDFNKADPALLDRLGQEASFFATWKWFADWPIMERTPRPASGDDPGGETITFRDVRFFSYSPISRGEYAPSDMPFSMEADLDPGGTLRAYRYNHRDKVYAYALTN